MASKNHHRSKPVPNKRGRTPAQNRTSSAIRDKPGNGPEGKVKSNQSPRLAGDDTGDPASPVCYLNEFGDW
jgi:hypothetical protein